LAPVGATEVVLDAVVVPPGGPPPVVVVPVAGGVETEVVDVEVLVVEVEVLVVELVVEEEVAQDIKIMDRRTRKLIVNHSPLVFIYPP